VRGLPDLTTTYNGREIFTAEGRYVQIQDFPAGTVAALEVYKSGLAPRSRAASPARSMCAGASRSTSTASNSRARSITCIRSRRSAKLPNGNLLISDRWDTGIGEMGLLVNVSYVGIQFLDSTREQSLVIGTTNAGNAPTAQAGLRFPDAQGNFLGLWQSLAPVGQRRLPVEANPRTRNLCRRPFPGFPLEGL
jgi:iron complex outermembrane receptor protein